MALKTLVAVIVASFVGLLLFPQYFSWIAIVGTFIALILIWAIFAGSQNNLNRRKWARFNEDKSPLGTAYNKYEGL